MSDHDFMAHRGRLRQAKAMLAVVLASFALTAPAVAAEAAVLVYHRFGEDDVPSTNIRLAQFEEQLDWLLAAGAAFPSLPEVVAALREGRALPDFSVVFTVDDAYRSAAIEAWPRLKARGIPLTIFAATEPVDDGNAGYLGWDELRALAAEGVTIGFHGHAHAHMAFMTSAAIHADLGRGVQRMTEELGQVPALFAYPYGEYSRALRNEIASVGFDAAFAQVSGVASTYADRMALPRFAINESYGALVRFQLVARAHAMPVAAVTPDDPLVADVNPPTIRFTLAKPLARISELACYPSHEDGAAPLKITTEGMVEVTLAVPLPPGRSRVNCTAPTGDGRWYWLGLPFLAPGGSD